MSTTVAGLTALCAMSMSKGLMVEKDCAPAVSLGGLRNEGGRTGYSPAPVPTLQVPECEEVGAVGEAAVGAMAAESCVCEEESCCGCSEGCSGACALVSGLAFGGGWLAGRSAGTTSGEETGC